MSEIFRLLGISKDDVGFEDGNYVMEIPDDKTYAKICQKVFSSDDFDLDDETFEISADSQTATYVYNNEEGSYHIKIEADYNKNTYKLTITEER